MTVNIFDLTGHQLDVIRTLGSVVGGLGGLAGGVAAVGAFMARYWAKQAAHQTRREDWTDGKLHTIPVSESVNEVVHRTEELRSEITDLYNDPQMPRVHGRRRLPTTEIPRLPPEESTYLP